VGLAVVQSQLQQDPTHQALNTLQVRFPYVGCIPYIPFCFFHFIAYSLGWGADCDSSDILAGSTSASALILAAVCHSKRDHSCGAYEELATV